MSKDIAQFVRKCQKCIYNKVKFANKEPMVITETPQKPFDIMIIDTVGPLMKSHNGNQYILTLICDLSKYLITVPMPDKTAKSVARSMFESFILIYGPMKNIRSDMGTEYKNELFSELCNLMRINHRTSTAYRHQSVGTVERNHRVLNEYLRSYVSDNLESWEEYLKYFTFCYNITDNSALNGKFSPYELIFSKKPNLPADLLTKVEPIYNIENFAKEAKYRLQMAHNQASKILTKLKMRNKEYYDKNCNPISINISDLVLIEKQPYDKYKQIYTGPYKVQHVNGSNVVVVDEKTNKKQIVHKDRIRVFKTK